MDKQEKSLDYGGYDDLPCAYAEPIIDMSKSAAVPTIDASKLAAVPQQQQELFAVRTTSVHFDDNLINQLVDSGFTRGLAQALDNMNNVFVKRIWIVDNSGSMNHNDGNRVIEKKESHKCKMEKCTRWDEIRDTIKYHIQLAGMIQSPTSFVFLNDPGRHTGPQRFEVSVPSAANNYNDGVKAAIDIMNKVEPNGFTPLTDHINGVQAEVSLLAPQLNAAGKQIAIVIATDGLPTDRNGRGGMHLQHEFIESLRSLQGLPVWVVIRLCTDEEDVVEFYNQIDSQLELSIEVIDDFLGEAKESHEHNPWLNYGLSIHRMREMGYHSRVFDMLDERKLTAKELQIFCEILFSQEHFKSAPDPSSDWNGFVKFVDHLLEKEVPHWNPSNDKIKPWISVKKLEKIYGDGTCSIL